MHIGSSAMAASIPGSTKFALGNLSVSILSSLAVLWKAFRGSRAMEQTPHYQHPYIGL